MKKLFVTFLFLLLILAFIGCKREVSAENILRDFLVSYGTEGIIYTPNKMIHEEGYISEGLLEKVYIYSGELPDNFALFLNQKSFGGFEAGVFICEDEDERASVTEMCYERIDLLTDKEGEGLLIRCRNMIIYTTASDKERAEEILKKIIRSCY